MSSVIARVQRRADAEIARQRALLADLGPDVADLLDVCEHLLQGGAALTLVGTLHLGGGRNAEAASLRQITLRCNL